MELKTKNNKDIELKCSSNEPLISTVAFYSWEEYAKWRRECQQKGYI